MRYGVLSDPAESAASPDSADSANSADLAGQPPTGAPMRTMFAVLVCLALLSAVLAPLAATPMAAVPAFLPLVQSALVGSTFLSAILLLGHVLVRRAWPLAILSGGCLATALAALAYMLALPGAGLEPFHGGRSQLAPWLFMAWHASFPLAVLGYTAGSGRAPPDTLPRIAAPLAALFVLALALLYAGGVRYLPALVNGGVLLPAFRWLGLAVLALTLLALWRVVRKRPRAALDVWLTVALAAWVGALVFSTLLSTGRYDLGYHAGRLFGLGGALFMLAAIAIDNVAAHARLRARIDDTIDQTVQARARAESQGLLGALLRGLPDGVLIVDAEGRCSMSNEEAARMAARFDHAGRGGASGPAAMLLLLEEPVRRAIAGEPFRDALLGSMGADGRRVFSVSGAPLRQEAQATAAAVIVVVDITERTEAGAALARAVDQTSYLVENTPLAVIEWDRDGVIRLWNRCAEALFGWSAQEAVGRRIDVLPAVHEEDAGKVAGAMGRLLDPATRYHKSSQRNRSRDGRVLYTEWYNSVLHDDNGGIDRVFSLVLDVSAREEALAELKEAERRADASIASLAHALRNPLAPIANAAALLRAKTLAPARIDWIAAMVGRQAGQMARLLDELLDLNRIKRGQMALLRAPLDLGSLLRDAIQAAMAPLEAGRHALVLDLCEKPLWVEGDAARLRQVLAALIDNAVRYTPPGGRIVIGLREEGGEARIEVRDSGIGIEADMLERVFDVFVQAGRAGSADGDGPEIGVGIGLGMGLSLARGLVALHGGRIVAGSAGPDQGAVLTVWLPALGAQAAAPTPGTGPDAADGAGAPLARSVLIADDDVDAAESLALLLRSEGAQVEVVYDGAAALRMYRARPAEIVVLDLGMPEMDGLEAASILARRKPRPFLVAVTGRGRQEDRAASLAAGFDEHFTKPVAAQQLIDLLRRV